MNRDIMLLLARYVARPIIVQLIALRLADDYAIFIRKLRNSGKYSAIYPTPINPKSARFYIIVYDNKKKYNQPIDFHLISNYNIKSLYIYKFDKLQIKSYIIDNVYFTTLSYEYDKYFSVLYKYNKLTQFKYCDIIKYICIHNCNYLSILNILRIDYWRVIFDNYSYKIYGYNNFIRYYYNSRIKFVSSQDGLVKVYYKTGAIMLEFYYNPAWFSSSYEFNRDSLRIYSPLGTRLM